MLLIVIVICLHIFLFIQIQTNYRKLVKIGNIFYDILE